MPVILHTDGATLDNIEMLTAAGGRYPDGTPWNPSNHPRDEKGKFRQVVAELKADLEGEVGTEGAVEGLKEIELQANQGDTDAAQQAASDVLEMVDQLAKNTEDKGLVDTLREGYGNLAEAVANLPLVFGDLNQKYRFSDLPPELKGLIEDLYKRADALLDPEHLQEAGGKLVGVHGRWRRAEPAADLGRAEQDSSFPDLIQKRGRAVARTARSPHRRRHRLRPDAGGRLRDHLHGARRGDRPRARALHTSARSRRRSPT